MANKYKARLKPNTGGHVGEDGKKYKAGDLVESNIDLINAFPGKFEDPDASGPGVENVTDDFEAALDNGYTVIKRNGKWYVCGEDGSGDELSGALTKKAVEDWIIDYVDNLPDEDDDEDDEDDEDAED